MKKILSLVLVLTMILSVVPVVPVAAEVSDPGLTAHTHSDAHTCGEKCPGGAITWTAWNNTSSLPTADGHYYLTADVQLTGTKDIGAGKDITICLNGYNIRSASTARAVALNGKLTISDCTAYTYNDEYIAGSVVGATCADGAIFSVRRGGTLVLESGKLTGGKTTNTAGGGAIFMQKGTSAGAGGKMYMYGGEISGNEGYNGGAICVGGADADCVPAAFYMYGGKITGNNARGNGGAIYLDSRSVAVIENGEVTENTAAAKAEAVLVSGAYAQLTVSGASKLDGVVYTSADNTGLKVNGLTNGATIKLTTVATDVTKMVSVAEGGKQDSWSAHWITANGESVSLVDGAFVLGHYHGNVKYEAYDGGASHNSLKSAAGNYYLPNDILRNTNGGAVTITASTTQHLCLNGFTITHRNPSGRLYNIQGKFFLEDCSAYTDEDGNYVSGGITYGGSKDSTATYGCCFSIQRGSVMTMTGGQIYGFTNAAASSSDGAVIYVQGAQTSSRAIFNLEGGEIHSNTTKSHGSAFRMTKATSSAATKNFSQINISGGKIWGNTTTGTAAIGLTGDELNITGGEISGNTSRDGGVYVTANSVLNISGAPVIDGNEPGNLYLPTEAIFNVGAMTGGKIGITAVTTDRAITTAVTDDPSAYFFSDDTELDLRLEEGRLYLGEPKVEITHFHNEDGSEGEMGWQPWTSTNKLPTVSGYYCLENDVILTERWNVTGGKDIHLCLNGKTITAPQNARHLQVQATAKLAIADCVGTGLLTGGNSTYGGAVSVTRRAEFTLYGGTISGNTANPNSGEGLGGAVYVQAGKGSEQGGIFNMYGGKLSDNTAYNGAAIMLAIGDDAAATPATANIYGGEISNNYSTGVEKVDANGNKSRTGGCGAAVYAGKYSYLNMEGGLITGNRGENYGSVLYFNNSEGKFSGGTITENISRMNGGAIYATTNSQIEITGDVLISKNQVISGYGGGISTSKSNLKISGGTISENIAKNGGTGLYLENSIFEMTGGVISKHDCPNYGGGAYLKNSESKITGGKITQNKSYKDGSGIHVYSGKVEIGGDAEISYNVNDKGMGAGVSFTKNCEARITGGRIVGNEASAGAGVYVQNKAHLVMTGGYIGANTTRTGSGCAIYSNKCNIELYGGTIGDNNTKKNGAVFANDATVRMGGITFRNNKTTGSGGGVYLTRCTVYMDGTRFLDNVVNGGAGGFYLHTCQIDLKNILVQGNSTTKDIAAGAYFYKCTGTVDKATVRKNSSKYVGGGFYMTRYNDVTVKDSLFEENYALVSGGAIYVSSWSKVNIDNCTVQNNTSGTGGGIHVMSCSTVYMNGGIICGNVATSRTGSNGKPIGGHAGGIYMQTSTGTQSGQSKMYLNGVTIENNKAKVNGGGICVNQQMIMHMDGCTIQNNYAEGSGGGIYQFTGSYLTVKNTKVMANSCELTGSGIYAGSDFEIEDSIITGNKTSDGAALYIPPARYDGHSYANGALKFGGDLQIFGNEGTLDDLYMDEGTAAGVSLQGFGKNTNIKIQLHSGVLTNTILGAYNYEGGDLHYTITYGDRSLVDPEYEGPSNVGTEEPTQQKNSGNIWLYAGVGVFGLAVIAAVVLLILKKKKSPAGEQK